MKLLSGNNELLKKKLEYMTLGVWETSNLGGCRLPPERLYRSGEQ